jgi:hypothetical protein
VIIRIPRPCSRKRSISRRTPARTETFEHRNGFVRHEQARLEDEPGGDRDTLPLPARELVRKPVEKELGRGEVDAGEGLVDSLRTFPLRTGQPVDRQRLLDRGPNAQARVERLVGILVDDLHPTAQRPKRPRTEPGDVAALEADRSGSCVDESQHSLRRRRLAAARLAHERQQLARSH